MTLPALPRPRKRFGQNFLVDQNFVRKIISRAALRPDEMVLEIGPGRGALTTDLCLAAAKVLAIEIDRDLYGYLQCQFAALANLELQLGDALDFPFHTLPAHTVVVANLPYNISTPLLFKLFEARASIDRMILMVQFEVAQRLVGRTGTRDYGVLSVIAQYFADIDLAFRVPRTCFRPRPDVASAIVEIRFKPVDANDDSEVVEEFLHVVKAAFSHRRKTLINSMRDAGFAIQVLQRVFDRVGIDGRRRAETLTVQDFQQLTRTLISF